MPWPASAGRVSVVYRCGAAALAATAAEAAAVVSTPRVDAGGT